MGKPLTFRSKLGMQKVVPTRIRVVAQEHAVASKGAPVPFNKGHDVMTGAPVSGERPKPDEKAMWAQPGDYALELVDKRGDFLGLSYLSGPAIQIVNYTPPQEQWFRDEPGTIAAIEIEPPGHTESRQKRLLDDLRTAKLANDITVFEMEVPNRDALKAAADGIHLYWRAIPAGITDEENDELAAGYGHLVGRIRALAQKVTASYHIQPPRHAGDLTVTMFQIEGLLRLAKGGN